MSARKAPGAWFGLSPMVRLACMEPDHLDPVTINLDAANRWQRRVVEADKRQRQKAEARVARRRST